MKKLKLRFESASSYMSEDELLSEIANLKSRGAEYIRLDLNQSWGDPELRWEFSTIETDEEYSQRLKQEKKEIEAKEAAAVKKQEANIKKREKDRALYEKLKKEFEPC